MKKLIIAIAVIASSYLQNSFANEKPVYTFQDIIMEYLNVKNELAKDNSTGAASSAATLLIAIKNIPADSLTSDESKVWKKYSAKLETNAELISKSNDIEHQREYFIKLSSNLYHILKSISMNSTELYYQFCPMANDGKGAYWISESSKIVNPYMGKKMSLCGETKSTIKAKQ